MSKFEIIVRGIFAVIFIVIANVWHLIIDSYISVQMSPAMQFSDDIDQRFGQDALNLASTVGVLLFVGIALLIIYPVGKSVWMSLNQSPKEDTNETA